MCARNRLFTIHHPKTSIRTFSMPSTGPATRTFELCVQSVSVSPLVCGGHFGLSRMYVPSANFPTQPDGWSLDNLPRVPTLGRHAQLHSTRVACHVSRVSVIMREHRFCRFGSAKGSTPSCFFGGGNSEFQHHFFM